MAQPKKKTDIVEKEVTLTATEKANIRWNLNDRQTQQEEINSAQDSITPAKPSARERANKRWGMTPDEENVDLVQAEQNVNIKDGQDSETDDEEENFVRKPLKSKVKARASSARKKIALFFATISVVLGLVGFVSYLPTLVMKQVMSKLSTALMDRVEYATERRVERYVSKYISNRVVPSLQSCGTRVSADCNVFEPGQGIISKLYTSWSNNRIETKLFDKYGLEFELFENDPNRIRVYKTNIHGVRGEVGEFGRNTVTKEISSMVRAETRFEGVRDRRHLRSLLGSPKYRANKWCMIACEQRDNIDEFRFSALQKLKLRIAARIAESVNAKLGTLLLCFVSGCGADETNRQLDNIALEFADRVDTAVLREMAEDIRARGSPKLGEYLIQRIIEKVFGRFLSESATKAATSAVPVAGQIYFAVSIIDMLDRIDSQIKNRELSNYLYSINAEAHVKYASTFLTLADENLSGEPDLSDAGATLQLLNGYGGSRLMQSLNGDEPTNRTECDNLVLEAPNDPLICPENKIRPTLQIEEFRNNETVDRFFRLANQYGSCRTPSILGNCLRIRTVVRPVLNTVNDLASGTLNLFLRGLRALPGIGGFISSVESLVSRGMSEILQFVATKILPISFDSDAEGARAVEQIAGGLDVSANGFLQGTVVDGELLGLGAPTITAQQQAELQVAIDNERMEEMKNQSMFARYFDFNNPHSLASTATIRVASVLPMSFGPLKTTFSPFGLDIAGNIGSFFGFNKKVRAAGLPTNREDLFGVPQFGFALDDPALNVDPDTLTPERCEEYRRAWEESEERDESTGALVHRVSNPCMLDEVVVDSLTKIWDLDPVGTVRTSNTPPVLAPVGDKFQDTSNLPCAAGSTSERIVTVGTGTRIKLCDFGGVRDVNASWSTNVSAMLASAASDGLQFVGGGFRTTQQQIQLRQTNGCPDIWTAPPSECDIPTAIPGTSNHELGLAIDFNDMCFGRGNTTCVGNPRYDWLVENAANFGISKLSSEAWHWSVDGG